MKFKMINVLSLLLILVFTFSSVTYAAENKNEKWIDNSESNIMALEGPTVIVDLGEYGTGVLQRNKNGDYSGELRAQASPVGVTAVSCVLSGNTGGIPNLYTIYIKWTGTNQVTNIRASKLSISTTSFLNPETFWSNSFFISAGSTTLGFSSIGVCSIPSSVKTVRIKTTGLQCFFSDSITWLSTGNIDGTLSVN